VCGAFLSSYFVDLVSAGYRFDFRVDGDHAFAERSSRVRSLSVGSIIIVRPRGMKLSARESVIHQRFAASSLRCLQFSTGEIDNAFVRDEAVFAFEKNWKVRIEPFAM